VDNNGYVGLYSSAALDPAGNPAISYYDQTKGDLKFAYWNGTRWIITTVDCSKTESHGWWGGWWGGHDYDRNYGNSQVRGYDKDNKWGYDDDRYENHGWWGWNDDRSGDTVYQMCYHGTGKVGKYSSLAFDPSGKPHISYYDESNGDLKYASWDGTRWIITTVDTLKNVGEYSSLAFDNSGNPRISYHDQYKGSLKYASWNGAKWIITTVDSYGSVGDYSSLAIDSTGKPRISYYDQSRSNLKYAAFDGSRWSIQVVDGVRSRGTKLFWDCDHGRWDDISKRVGQFSSLALDSTGKPRISYYDQTNSDLKYAAWNGTMWVITTVDNSKHVGEFTSLELDTAGNPRVSYYDMANRDLKFAAWNTTYSKWMTETVDSSGKVGSYTSLVLDKLGNPGISYYDESNHALKYTRGTGHAQPTTAPTVTSIAPNSGTAGTFVTITNLAGTNFVVGSSPSVQLKKTGEAAITATNITVVSPTKITCTFTLPALTTSSGLWDVVVTNPNGESGMKPAAFNVTAVVVEAPTVTAITPANGVAGSTIAVTDLSGTGFATGATVKLTKIGAPDINATDVVVASPTKITCTLVLPAASATSAGTYTVVVKNADGQSASLADAFTVTNTGPTLNGIDPASGVAGISVPITNLSGTGFLSGATVKFTRTGAADIAATSVTVVSATQITCTFPLPAPSATSAGTWNVVLTNGDGQTATLGDAFTVTNPVPTVTGITPSSSYPGVNLSVTNLAGTNFITGTKPTVWLAKTGQTNIMATDVTVVSPTQITCTFALPSWQSTVDGQYDLSVQNVDGQSGVRAGAFTILKPAVTITSLSPDYGFNGTTLTLEAVGTNIDFGTNPSIWLEKAGASNIEATSIHIYPPDRISFVLSIPLSAQPGVYDFMMKTPDGSITQATNAFTIKKQLDTTPLTWTWSTDGWTDWQSSVTCTAGTCTPVGPTVSNGVGLFGSSATMDLLDSTTATVTKTFTSESGRTFNKITFTGKLNGVDSGYEDQTLFTIKVNGASVFSEDATKTPPGNGQTDFTITRTFNPAETVVVEIIRDTTYAGGNTQYVTEFSSLTLS
jgi:hypothetical protein